MPAETKDVVAISCDNPKCAGHSDLKKTDRTGWLFINSEVYGNQVQSTVFGSIECLTQATTEDPTLFVGEPTPVTP